MMKYSFTVQYLILFVCTLSCLLWTAVADRKYMKMKHKPIAYRNTTMLSMHPREIDPVTGRKIGGQYVYRNSKQQVEFELDSKLGDRNRRGDRRDGKRERNGPIKKGIQAASNAWNNYNNNNNNNNNGDFNVQESKLGGSPQESKAGRLRGNAPKEAKNSFNVEEDGKSRNGIKQNMKERFQGYANAFYAYNGGNTVSGSGSENIQGSTVNPTVSRPNSDNQKMNENAIAMMNAGDIMIEELIAPVPELFAYFATLGFDGDQEIDVLVDTGSANLLVPVLNCPDCEVKQEDLDLTKAKARTIHCEDPKCRGPCNDRISGPMLESLSDSLDSDVYCGPNGGYCVSSDVFGEHIEEGSQAESSCLFYSQYADGSYAAGFMVDSNLELAGFEAHGTYGAIVGASENFFEIPQGGGILGMSFSDPTVQCNALSCFPPVLDALVEQNDLDDVFAMCGSHTEPLMVLGGGDDRLYKGELKYVPLVPPFNVYWVDVIATKVNDYILPSGGAKNTILDTGTTGLLLPYTIFREWKAYIQDNYCHIPFVCNNFIGPNIFSDTCIANDVEDVSPFLASFGFMGESDDATSNSMLGLPPFTMELANGVKLEVDAKDYLLQVDYMGRTYSCMTIFGWEDNDELFLVGENILQHYYVEFDRQNKRLGIAESVDKCYQAVGL